jgi:hypothetical protein
VVTLATNLKRDFGGAQLTSSALALGVSRMLIASGAMHGEIVPAGTHPALDHRFSTERTEIVHYGDASRLEKVARIARSAAAMETLTVCRYNKAEGDENCGECEKCLRTMLELHIAGALEACPRFDRPLDPQLVAGLRKRLSRRHQWLEILHALGPTANDRALAAAVHLVIGQSDLRGAAYELRDASRDSSLATVAPHLPVATKRGSALALQAHGELDVERRRPPRAWQRLMPVSSWSDMNSVSSLRVPAGLAIFVALCATIWTALEEVFDLLEGEHLDAGILTGIAAVAGVAAAIWIISGLAIGRPLLRRGH